MLVLPNTPFYVEETELQGGKETCSESHSYLFLHVM